MPKNEVNTANTLQNYRCFVNQSRSAFFETEDLTSDFHLERAEHDEVVIVEDRKKDWKEIANKDVNEVGLRYVLGLVDKQQLDLDSLAYSEDEALDLSDLNPMDPQSVKNTVAAQSQSEAKLDSIAKQLGVTRDVLIESFINGSFSSLVESKTQSANSQEGDK